MAFGDDPEEYRPMRMPQPDSPVAHKLEEQDKEGDFFTFDAQEDEKIEEHTSANRLSNPYAAEISNNADDKLVE